jgi:carbonic anhydrase/acetyltransferase-like protein (isoleucine patch superfamily)
MPLPLYIITKSQQLEIFGDPIGDALILNKRLADWQQDVAKRAGLQVQFVRAINNELPPYFVMSEDVFFTKRYLNEFVRRATAIGRNCRAGLTSNELQDRLVRSHSSALHVPGGYCYDLRYVADNSSEEEFVLITMDDLKYSTFPLPQAISKTRRTIYCSSTMALLQITAPLHLYQANMHANFEACADRVFRGNFAPTTQSDERWNRIGSNCSIHPTAYLEGCDIGDGTQVGAYAVLRYSTLGRGARIADAVNMFRSVVGENTQICEQHRVIMSVIYPECFLISGALQFSIMGYASGIFAAWITDARMDQQTLKTVVGGKVVDSGLHYLGCIMGHRAKVTAGVVTAPGRVIPNDAEIHLAPHLTYRGLPANHRSGMPYFVGEEEET